MRLTILLFLMNIAELVFFAKSDDEFGDALTLLVDPCKRVVVVRCPHVDEPAGAPVPGEPSAFATAGGMPALPANAFVE